MEEKLLKLVFAALFFVVLTSEASAIDFNDGGIHIVNSAVSGVICLDWNKPGKNTMLYVVDGAKIIDTHTGVAVIAYQDSILHISGGYMQSRVECVGRSTAYFCDGIIYNGLHASSESTVYMSGGRIGGYLGAYGHGTVYLSGGMIGNELSAFSDGRIFVTGGDIDVTIRASQNSCITLYGTNFNYEYGEIVANSGKITGTLLSGEVIDSYFYINDNAKIILAVPEPTTICLFALASLMLRKK